MVDNKTALEFKRLAKTIKDAIAEYSSKEDGDFTTQQKEYVENLLKLEKKFKKVLQKDSRGLKVYKKFIDHIWHSGRDNNRNTLTARPYFRERQTSFSKGISPAIKKQKPKWLYKFNINYPFIEFVLKTYSWGPNSKVVKAAREVYEARQKIIVLNTPLAISRARIFKHKVPESHLTYMDLVQTCFEGLVNAIDKYAPGKEGYTPVFRSVIIGRCVGDLIQSYSETLLHFYPNDKRKLYRANKANRNDREITSDQLAKMVNDGSKLTNPTNPAEIHLLTAAAGHLSLDSPMPEISDHESGETLKDNYVAGDEVRPDNQAESSELYNKLYKSFTELDVLDCKLLQLMGIDFTSLEKFL
jgi:DNA-directed RNA polymerase specialized sigma subunit